MAASATPSPSTPEILWEAPPSPPPTPTRWEAYLAAPAFVINLERRPDRWASAQRAIERAGYTNIQRYNAVDALDSTATQYHYETVLGAPPFHPTFNNDFKTWPGTFGVFLSQVLLWKKIVEEAIPVATIFEDDVLFHTDWDTLAPTYYNATPTDYDLCFLGSQIEFPSKYHIDKGPVFCLHAYTLTCTGAKRLLDYVLSPAPGGIYTIDTMLKVAMEKDGCPFHWYVWNALFYPCPIRNSMTLHWRKRNSGLVYQNESLGTDIREYEPFVPATSSVVATSSTSI